MCDRYSLALTKQKLARRFQVKITQAPEIHYNISPDSTIPVIVSQPDRRLAYYRWGIENAYAVNKKKAKHIHALPISTLLKQSHFQHLVQTQRCLIPADGFYVWHHISRKSQVPYRIVLKWNMPFAFAAIWESYADADEKSVMNACSLFTTDASELLKKIHPIMPVILPLELEEEWLKPDLPFADAFAMLKPFPAANLNCFPVSTQINDPAFNSAILLQPVQPTDQFGNYILFEE